MTFSSFAEAAEKGVKRAIDAGCEAPMLYVHNTDKFPQAETVAILVSVLAQIFHHLVLYWDGGLKI